MGLRSLVAAWRRGLGRRALGHGDCVNESMNSGRGTETTADGMRPHTDTASMQHQDHRNRAPLNSSAPLVMVPTRTRKVVDMQKGHPL